MTTLRARRALGLLVAPLLLVGAPAAADGPDDRGCNELVTHAPSGSDGDQGAVAITSQVLVADVDGWERVSWEADEDVEVDAVLVDTADGTEVREGTPTGEAHGAHQLTFCGEVIEHELVGFASEPSGTLTAGPLPEGGLPLLGAAAVGGLLAGLVLLASRGGRRGRPQGRVA